jgi:hypothetical protein
MFYRQCNDCNEQWELGNPSTCKCNDKTGITKLQCVNHDCNKCKEQHKWVGLTDDELFDCWESAMNGNVYTKMRVYNAIEAKLRSKNNG